MSEWIRAGQKRVIQKALQSNVRVCLHSGEEFPGLPDPAFAHMEMLFGENHGRINTTVLLTNERGDFEIEPS